MNLAQSIQLQKELRQSLIGTEAIFRDRPMIARVRINDALTDERGLSLELEVIPSTGFYNPLPKNKIPVGTAWDGAAVSAKEIVSAPYGGWLLYLDPGLMARLVEHAESLGDTEAKPFDYDVAHARYGALSKFIDRHNEADQRTWVSIAERSATIGSPRSGRMTERQVASLLGYPSIFCRSADEAAANLFRLISDRQCGYVEGAPAWLVEINQLLDNGVDVNALNACGSELSEDQWCRTLELLREELTRFIQRAI